MMNLKYRKPEEMKDSGVEWVGSTPIGWESVRFKRCFIDTSGNGFPRELQGNECGEIPFYKVSDINESDKYVDRSRNYVSYRQAAHNNWSIIKKGSILTAKIGEALRKNHRKINRWECIIDNNMVAFSVRDGDDIGYWYYLTQIIDMDWYANPGAVPTVNMGHLRNTKLPKCGTHEQRRIASFLDYQTARFNSIISKKERLIEKLEEAKRSLISEVVTGKVKIVDGHMVEREPEEMKDSGIEWLGVVPRDWQIKRTKYLSKINQKTLSNNENAGMLINYIDIGSVDSTGEINQIQHFRFADAPSRARRIVTTDDIIVSTVRTYLKAIAFIEKQYNGYVCSTGFATLSSDKDKLNPKFLYYLLVSEKYINEIVARSVGVSYPAINASEIGDLFCVYPRIEEQNSIVSFLDTKIESVNGVINKLERLVSMLREAKQALISEAVTGKIDLRDWEIIEEGEGQ